MTVQIINKYILVTTNIILSENEICLDSCANHSIDFHQTGYLRGECGYSGPIPRYTLTTKFLINTHIIYSRIQKNLNYT